MFAARLVPLTAAAPGTALPAVCKLVNSLCSTAASHGGRHREVKPLAQGHTARKWGNRDLNLAAWLQTPEVPEDPVFPEAWRLLALLLASSEHIRPAGPSLRASMSSSEPSLPPSFLTVL